MAAKQAQYGMTKSQQVRRQQALEALERGELVRLMAEADTGKLPLRDFEDALDQYERKHWCRRLFATLLGRRA